MGKFSRASLACGFFSITNKMSSAELEVSNNNEVMESAQQSSLPPNLQQPVSITQQQGNTTQMIVSPQQPQPALHVSQKQLPPPQHQQLPASSVDGSGCQGVDGSGPPPTDLESTKAKLLFQLEYYFSRENLDCDTQMDADADFFVPISKITGLNQISRLTSDINLVTQILRESPNMEVDAEGKKVRPNHTRYSTVILGEIPEHTQVDELKELLSSPNCPKFVSCEMTKKSFCYVTFDNDEDAQKAFSFLTEEVKTFKGTPIMARIKYKPINRSTGNYAGGKGGGVGGTSGGTAPPCGNVTTAAPAPTNQYCPPPSTITASTSPAAVTASTTVTNQPPPSGAQAVEMSYPMQAQSPAQIPAAVPVVGSCVTQPSRRVYVGNIPFYSKNRK